MCASNAKPREKENEENGTKKKAKRKEVTLTIVTQLFARSKFSRRISSYERGERYAILPAVTTIH